MKKYLFLAIASLMCVASWGQDYESLCSGKDAFNNIVMLSRHGDVYYFSFTGLSADAQTKLCLIPLGQSFGDVKEFVDFLIGVHWANRGANESVFTMSADGNLMSVIYEPLKFDDGVVHNVLTIGYTREGERPLFTKIHLVVLLRWQMELLKRVEMRQYVGGLNSYSNT